MSSTTPPLEPEALPPAEKVKQFPAAPGVYLMKDAQGRVVYVGSAKSLRTAMQVLQRIFKFRTCSLDITADDQRWRWFRPCLLHSIKQCTAPCNFRVTKEEYRKQIRALRLVLEGKKARLLREMERDMQEA